MSGITKFHRRTTDHSTLFPRRKLRSNRTQADFEMPAGPSYRLSLAVVLLSLLLPAGVAIAMYKGGLFEKPNDEIAASVLDATLVLLGTLIVQSLTAGGLILKHSFDLRTHQISVFEQQRLASEKRLEHDRLRHDTALKAVGLLATSDGKIAPSSQQAGALQAMATLGMAAVAVSLVDLRRGSDDTPLVTQGALAVLETVWRESDSESTKAQACSVLRAHAAKLVLNPDTVLLPEPYFTGAWIDAAPEVDRGFIAALIDLLRSNTFRQADRLRGSTHSATIYHLLNCYSRSASNATSQNRLTCEAAIHELATELSYRSQLPPGLVREQLLERATRAQELIVGFEVPPHIRSSIDSIRTDIYSGSDSVRPAGETVANEAMRAIGLIRVVTSTTRSLGEWIQPRVRRATVVARNRATRPDNTGSTLN